MFPVGPFFFFSFGHWGKNDNQNRLTVWVLFARVILDKLALISPANVSWSTFYCSYVPTPGKNGSDSQVALHMVNLLEDLKVSMRSLQPFIQ